MDLRSVCNDYGLVVVEFLFTIAFLVLSSGFFKFWRSRQYTKMSKIRLISEPFLDGTRKVLTLSSKRYISHDTLIFRFVYSSQPQTFGLPIGKHIRLITSNYPNSSIPGKWNGKDDIREEIERKYTPIEVNDMESSIDLLIKVYRSNEKPSFPDGGRMSRYLESLAVGETIHVFGPVGQIQYLGVGSFKHGGKTLSAEHICMIAGGSGITPILQVLKYVLREFEATKTKVITDISILFANQTEDDILLKDVLDEIATKYQNGVDAPIVRVWYTVDSPKNPDTWIYSVGYITADMIAKHLPPPSASSIVLVCGPPPMVKFACRPNLEFVGFSPSQIIEF